MSATLPSSTPIGIIANVPITITNSQASSTIAPFEQMLTVDSAAYSTLEARNLQNVEFFSTDGTIVPSWLESGNTNTAASTIYWLNIAGGIPASSTLTLYMGFASPSTNLFNSQTTGEAPQLSPSYGQYDNGANVFSYYCNWIGTSSCTGWVAGAGTPAVDNGVTLSSITEIIDLNPVSFPTVFDTSVVGRTGSGSIKLGVSTNTVSPNQYGDVAPSYFMHVPTMSSLVSDATYPTMCTVSSSPSSTSPFVETIGWKNGEEFGGWDYSHQCTAADTSIPIGNIHPWLTASDGGSWRSDWIRARAFPPNGVMPVAAVVPAGILQYVPITISNSQPNPTPAPFQQMLTVNSVAYSSLEAPNLQNVEFFSSDGTIVPSWLESGNANTAAGTIYWLKIAGGIPASSSITVYMGFASQATNLFNTETTGEAPQLSSTYGQYDDGRSVFAFYDNFLGTSLDSSKWSVAGLVPILNNGITFPLNGYILSIPQFDPTVYTAEAYGYANSADLDRAFTFLNWLGSASTLNVGMGSVPGPAYELRSCVGCVGSAYQAYFSSPIPGSFTAPQILSVRLNLASSTILGSINYGPEVSLPHLDSSISNFVSSLQVGLESGFDQYVRMRLTPPNGVMPATTFGATIPTARSSVYVGNSYDGTVSVIGGANNTVTTTVNTGRGPAGGPAGVAFDPHNGFVYVAIYGSDSVSVIKASTNTVVGAVGVGIQPVGVAFDSSNNEVYVANSGSDTVSVISDVTNTVVKTVPVGRGPWGVAFDSSNNDIYVTDSAGSTVSVIDGNTNTVTATIGVGSYPNAVVFDSASNDIYVTNYYSNTVSIIDGTTNTVVKTVNVGSLPDGVDFDPSNNNVYVANQGSDSVSVISGATGIVLENVTVGTRPFGVAFDSVNGNVYVVNGGANGSTDPSTVSVIDTATNSVVATVGVGARPEFLAVSVTSTTAAAFDYSLSSSGPVSIQQVSSGSVTITAALTAGTAEPVILSCVAPLPTGVTCSFDTNPVTPTVAGATSVLHIGTSASTPLGSLTVMVTGSPLGATTTETGVSVTVTPVPLDYSLSNNGPVAIQSGSSGTVTITATLTSGTAQPVALSCVIPLPSGVTCTSFTSSSVTPTQSSVLTITVASGTAAGHVSVQVAGTPVGATTTPTSVSVMIVAPPPPAFNYTLSVNPTSASIVAGSSTSAIVTATLTSGATQPVALIFSISPNPAVCQVSSGTSPCGNISFSPSGVTPSSTGATSSLTVSTTTVVPPGTYTLFITGSPAGSSSSSAKFTLTITAPFVSTVSCGHDVSCSVQSNATLSKIRFAGVTIHVEADGPSGAHGYANVTVPKAAIQSIDNVHVFVDDSKLSGSAVVVSSNATDYFIYFTFTFHSPVLIDIQLSSPENAATPTILGLDPTVFYGIVGAIVVASVLVAVVAYRTSKHRSRTVEIPRQ